MKKKISTIILIISFILLLILLNVLLNNQSKEKLGVEENTVVKASNKIEENTVESEDSMLETKDAYVTEVTSQTFKDEVLNSEKTVLIDFYADWCGPCKILSPIVEEVAKENPDIKVVKVDVDLCQDLALEYNTISIPTLVVIKNGEEVDRVVGLVDKTTILELVK